MFATHGWNAPVAAIATRAGVGMGSLYRRYGSKTELLQYLCLLSMRQTIEAATIALALEGPWESLSGYIKACVAMGAGAFAPLAGVIEVTEEMLDTAKKSNRLLARVVERARRSGQLRRGDHVTDTDIWWSQSNSSAGTVRTPTSQTTRTYAPAFSPSPSTGYVPSQAYRCPVHDPTATGTLDAGPHKNDRASAAALKAGGQSCRSVHRRAGVTAKSAMAPRLSRWASAGHSASHPAKALGDWGRLIKYP